MTLADIYKEADEYMQKSIEAMKRDFKTLRTGKVSAVIVEGVKVDYYGSLTPLSQVSSITALDASTLQISPWEKNLLKEIERAINEANIGVNPNNDGENIKLCFPPMTSEQRKEIAKEAKVMGEKAKVAIRNNRKDANDQIKKLEKDKSVSLDEAKRAYDEIQKKTDDFIKKVEETLKNKENEILKL
ncbi:ribosome recycling factor [Helicobacter monodelphidis]|uniref:ribosome recycling factor n=1 Tax=Helicobacter sp. 15-1451 TaxID=2004995 RepID=UPI000DCEB129|nr:ribosome recycling factor [Helicobacter sp. 15-1451]RAX57630.1 ribosome recycling factor [Helicobacter sp. 15-1451]